MGRRQRAVPLTLPGLPEAPVHRPPGAPLRRPSSKRRRSPAPRPWEAIVLGVDTARRSGWAVTARGRLVARGELDTLDAGAIRSVVAEVVAGAERMQLPAVIVLEKPWGGNSNIVAALGQARERWLVAWRELADGARGRVVLVMPSTWRSAVLGSYFASAPREECRAAERSMALGITGATEVGGDEAAAVCISHWASRAGDVGKKLSKTAQRASLAAWGGGA